jgi:hypothetical protein
MRPSPGKKRASSVVFECVGFQSTTLEAHMNVATESLDTIHKTLLIDEQWTTRRERGFTWWAHRLEHHIDAGPPIDDDGIVITRITSRIPILCNVRAAPHVVEQVLAEWNFFSDSYCYVYDPETRCIDSVQSGIVHEQTLHWRPGLLASQFIVQLDHAEKDATTLRRTLRGRIASSAHPTLGRRKAPDDMLEVIRYAFLPYGEGENLFANKFEFGTIVEQTERINAASFGASETGVAIEVPFGDSTALITLTANERNPRIGQGLGVFLQLPIFTTFDECARLAAWLNRREAAGEFLSPSIGAWSVKREGDSCTVARCGFIPNALHHSGLALDAAYSAMNKLRQVNALFNPGVPVPKAWDVIARRMGKEAPAIEGHCEAVVAQPQ